MKDFEYKAWHRHDRKVYDVASINFVTQTVGILRDVTDEHKKSTGEYYVHQAHFTEIELMPNIGLKDKHDKSIYKNSIVKTTLGNYMRIVYRRGAYGAVDIYNELIFGVFSDPNFLKAEDLEVVGDIYTTPELYKN